MMLLVALLVWTHVTFGGLCCSTTISQFIMISIVLQSVIFFPLGTPIFLSTTARAYKIVFASQGVVVYKGSDH